MSRLTANAAGQILVRSLRLESLKLASGESSVLKKVLTVYSKCLDPPDPSRALESLRWQCGMGHLDNYPGYPAFRPGNRAAQLLYSCHSTLVRVRIRPLYTTFKLSLLVRGHCGMHTRSHGNACTCQQVSRRDRRLLAQHPGCATRQDHPGRRNADLLRGAAREPMPSRGSRPGGARRREGGHALAECYPRRNHDHHPPAHPEALWPSGDGQVQCLVPAIRLHRVPCTGLSPRCTPKLNCRYAHLLVFLSCDSCLRLLNRSAALMTRTCSWQISPPTSFGASSGLVQLGFGALPPWLQVAAGIWRRISLLLLLQGPGMALTTHSATGAQYMDWRLWR